MLETLFGWVKGLFGGKGTVQIGSGNQNTTVSTTGHNSPAYSASRDMHMHIPVPTPKDADSDLFADLEEPVNEFLAWLATRLTEHPLLRDIIVTDTQTVEPNWPGPHLWLAEDKNPDIRARINILVGHGLIVPLDSEDCAYRLTARLVKRLRKAA